jgi:hypothetical protein
MPEAFDCYALPDGKRLKLPAGSPPPTGARFLAMDCGPFTAHLSGRRGVAVVLTARPPVSEPARRPQIEEGEAYLGRLSCRPGLLVCSIRLPASG